MRRLTLLVPLALVFAAGFALGTSRLPDAEARPRPTCKDDLSRVQRELTAARAEAKAARAETARLLDRERTRVQQLEQQIGAMAGGSATDGDLGAPIQQLK